MDGWGEGCLFQNAKDGEPHPAAIHHCRYVAVNALNAFF